MKIIREYEGALGKVTVTEYKNEATIEYAVKHDMFPAYWTKDKTEAIKHAQFLAAKY